MAIASPIRFAGSELRRNRHVCAFCNSADEAYRALMPFIKDGFGCGDKALHIINPGNRDAHLHRLMAAGIDAEGAEHSGQLEILSTTEAYTPNGHFDQDRMVEVFEAAASGKAGGRFPLSRIVCEMDWAATAATDIVNVVEFEARINDVWQSHDDAVICVYDIGKFGGEAIVDIMRTHPMIIIGGLLHENPFFVPPAQFLKELADRHVSGDRSPKP